MSLNTKEFAAELLSKGGFRRLYVQGEIQLRVPELTEIEQYLHSPKYHPEGSLLEHYCRAFDTLIDILDGARVDMATKHMAMWGLLFHDIGKPACAKLNEETGFHSYIRHESVGGDIFRDNYSVELVVQDEDPEIIEWIIREHTNYWNIMKHGKSLAMANHPAFYLLSLVCQADKMGFDHEGLPSNEERLAHFAEVSLKGVGH